MTTWWVGQDLGVFGGMGTDPNSGAIVLLGLMAYASIGFAPPKTADNPPDHAYPPLPTSA